MPESSLSPKNNFKIKKCLIKEKKMKHLIMGTIGGPNIKRGCPTDRRP
jgi:hypothetical protein